MPNSKIDLSKRGKCSGRHFNCGAHALTHVLITQLLADHLDRHFEENSNYQLLLSTFRKFYNIDGELTVQNLKNLFCYYTHPYDREIIFGDVLRQFFSDIHANNEDYKSERKEYFKTILIHHIKKNNNLTAKRALPGILQSVDFFGVISNLLNWFFSTNNPFDAEDNAVDTEFVRSNKAVQAFLDTMSSEFQRLSVHEADPLNFLERNTGNGFYDQENIQTLINTFWEKDGFAAWVNYINTFGVMLPIDVLMNGAAALDFDVTMIIAGGYTWHNRIETAVEGVYTPRTFSMTAYNLRGVHYEVELDSPEKAKIHNLQFEGYGIFEDKEKIPFNLNEADIRVGKLQGRKIINDQAPRAEITRFLKDMPASPEAQARWIQILNTSGRPDRNIPREHRKSIQSEFLTVLQWATLQASIHQKLQSDPSWATKWHTALKALNANHQNMKKLTTWCNKNLRALPPFTTMPIKALRGWAKENVRLCEDFTKITEEQWAIEANDKGGLLNILLEQYNTVETNVERQNVFNLIFQQWQKYNMSSLGFWDQYRHMPVGQALDAAQKILTLSADLAEYLPEESRPAVELLEEYVKTGNLVELYKMRQQLYPYQFNNSPTPSTTEAAASSSSVKTLPTLAEKRKRNGKDEEQEEPSTVEPKHQNKRRKISGPG